MQPDFNAEFGRYITQDEAFIFICQRATMMYSLLGACKVLGKASEKHLAHTPKHIGSTKTEDLHYLLYREWTE